MSPEDIFKDKAVALAVQGILLFSAIIYTTHDPTNFFIILCITTLLTLYVLQALNHRFRYYFPYNSFFCKNTKEKDTYFLYFLTFLAFFFFLTGLTHSIITGGVLSLIIIIPGPVWYFYASKRISSNIEFEMKKEDYIVSLTKCPECGGQRSSSRFIYRKK